MGINSIPLDIFVRFAAINMKCRSLKQEG
jgi:hypothetical protein